MWVLVGQSRNQSRTAAQAAQTEPLARCLSNSPGIISSPDKRPARRTPNHKTFTQAIIPAFTFYGGVISNIYI